MKTRHSYFRLASESQNYQTPRRERFVLAEPLNPTIPTGGNFHIRTWIGQSKKSSRDVKIIVDSFYTNGNFNKAKYENWFAQTKKKIQEKMSFSLSNKDRSEIRAALYNRTQQDLSNIRF